MNVKVLRLGHRFSRDARISTHLALTSRAFGAHEICYDVRATDVKESVDKVSKIWGKGFEVSFTDNPKKTIRDFEGVSVHLTMYGMPINDKIDEIISADRNVLVIVGGKKVPSEIYNIVDYNVAVGSQPHSEVAALAVFLDRLFSQNGLEKEFDGGQRIIPQERGKKVV